MGSLVLHRRVTQHQRFLLLVCYLYLQTRVHHAFSNNRGSIEHRLWPIQWPLRDSSGASSLDPDSQWEVPSQCPTVVPFSYSSSIQNNWPTMYGDESQQLGLSMNATSREYENLEQRQREDSLVEVFRDHTYNASFPSAQTCIPSRSQSSFPNSRLFDTLLARLLS